MTAYVQALYTSESEAQLSETDVQVILGESQVRNRRADITGMLVRTGSHFLQILEGRAEPVAALLSKIEKDARHRDVRVLARLAIERRAFSQWSMGLAVRPDLAPEVSAIHAAGVLAEGEALRVVASVRRTTEDAPFDAALAGVTLRAA